jgi:hypothetical protein
MSFKITTKKQAKVETYGKVYMKLIGLEFSVGSELLSKRGANPLSVATNTGIALAKAKEHFRSVYKSLCLDLTGRDWSLSADSVCV